MGEGEGSRRAGIWDGEVGAHRQMGCETEWRKNSIESKKLGSKNWRMRLICGAWVRGVGCVDGGRGRGGKVR